MGSMVSNEFLFSFEDRINRLKYWYGFFASLISGLFFLWVLAFAIGGIFGTGVESVDLNPFDIFSIPPSLPFRASFGDAGPWGKATLIPLAFYAAGTPIYVVSTWFLLATTIKRLHDRDRSGWWIVPFFIALSFFNQHLGRSSLCERDILVHDHCVGSYRLGPCRIAVLEGDKGA